MNNISELVTHFRNLLVEPRLLETAIFFNPSWENTERYQTAIPVGRSRRTGQTHVADMKTVNALMSQLATRPKDFPNPRFTLDEDGFYDVRWGDDISALWKQPCDVEKHRQIGRAFGYREEQIVGMYPDDWDG
jgi:hypothetical protein